MPSQSLSFVLSHEEILLILHLLEAPALPGLDVEALAGMPREERAQRLSTAERSLKARGFVSVLNDGTVELDPVVVSLVCACTVPNCSFLATTQTSQSSQVRYYHRHRESNTLVEQAFPELGFHEFSSLPTSNSVAERMEAFLGLHHQPSPLGSPFEIPEDTLTRARDIARRSSLEATAEYLRTCGLSEETAHQFALATVNPVRNGSVVRVDYVDQQDRNETKVSGFATLEGPDGIWMLAPVPKDESGKVRAAPASAETTRARLRHLVLQDKPMIASAGRP
jgi:hypothetical protein